MKRPQQFMSKELSHFVGQRHYQKRGKFRSNDKLATKKKRHYRRLRAQLFINSYDMQHHGGEEEE